MLEIKDNQLNLGQVKTLSDSFFNVIVKNTDDEPKAVVAKPSCGSCTFLHSGPAFIPAKGEGFYAFRFRPETVGEVVRSVYFLVGDIKQADFVFKAQVI